MVQGATNVILNSGWEGGEYDECTHYYRAGDERIDALDTYLDDALPVRNFDE